MFVTRCHAGSLDLNKALTEAKGKLNQDTLTRILSRGGVISWGVTCVLWEYWFLKNVYCEDNLFLVTQSHSCVTMLTPPLFPELVSDDHEGTEASRLCPPCSSLAAFPREPLSEPPDVLPELLRRCLLPREPEAERGLWNLLKSKVPSSFLL